MRARMMLLGMSTKSIKLAWLRSVEAPFRRAISSRWSRPLTLSAADELVGPGIVEARGRWAEKQKAETGNWKAERANDEWGVAAAITPNDEVAVSSVMRRRHFMKLWVFEVTEGD